MRRMKKEWLVFGIAGLAALIAAAALWLLPGKALPGWERPEGLSRSRQRQIQAEVREIGECVRLYGKEITSRADVDAVEAILMEQGLPVLDTDAFYPAYLGNPNGLRQFWQKSQAGENAEASLIRVMEDGGFYLRHFYYGTGEACCVLVKVGWEEGQLYVSECERLPLYDMELTDWDIFYYRLFPKDPHYIDYMEVRLTAPDREKYDLCGKYILPVGYQMVNCFLCDWQEGDWGSMSFNDVFEALYRMETGEPQFNWTEYVDPQNTGRARIPAALFEKTVMRYFRISREELRELAGYQEETDSYSWRPFFGDDLTSRSYPMCEPQIAEVRENPDGTVSLEVQVASPETKTDCLFTHTLVVRPGEDGSFQYVSNQVTEVGQWGLPFDKPRFTLD